MARGPMATDLDAIVRSLIGFHDLRDKTVVAVGAGGGQLSEYARTTRQVIAVDRDEAALERLRACAAERGLADKFTPLSGDLLAVSPRGDLVLFEFCLHQMAEPERALDHAAGLAPEVLVIDHAPGSLWEWCAAEEAGVEAAWAAVGRRTVRRQLDVEGVQRFQDYAELESRLAAQGPKSRERIAAYRGQFSISIAMPYRLALL
jgi:methyltransferase family protein